MRAAGLLDGDMRSGDVLDGPMIVNGFDAWQVRRSTHDAVRGALGSGGIVHEMLTGLHGETSRLAVRPSQWILVQECLLALAKDENWWVQVTTSDGRRVSRSVRDGRLPTFLGARSITVFRYLAAPDGSVLADERLGTSLVPLELGDGLVSSDSGGLVEELPSMLEVREPIDVVYTWVDGSDPRWRARRDSALSAGSSASVNATAVSASRFASREELRFSLRSLEMFAGWARRVYVVTDGQTPSWLDARNPRIQVVDHRDIFADPTVLPVFNSHAIESQLHRVPGVADRYLYMNDDVFFGRPVRPELFFDGNGMSRFFLSDGLIDPGPATAGDLPVMAAAKRNRDLLVAWFGLRVSQKFKHAPHTQVRSVLEEMERAHPEVFAQVAASRFRHPDDVSIAASMHHYYAYAQHHAVPGAISYAYEDIAHEEIELHLNGLLRERNRDVFCLNEVDIDPVADARARPVVAAFLAAYFPFKSSFER